MLLNLDEQWMLIWNFVHFLYDVWLTSEDDFQEEYMPTSKIQGQIYHRVGSLLPVPDAEHKFV